MLEFKLHTLKKEKFPIDTGDAFLPPLAPTKTQQSLKRSLFSPTAPTGAEGQDCSLSHLKGSLRCSYRGCAVSSSLFHTAKAGGREQESPVSPLALP